LFLLFVVALAVGFGFAATKIQYKQGLDIKGGTRLTYLMDTSKLKPEEKRNLPDMQKRIATIIGGRAAGSFGVAEPNIIPKGDDQLIVEIPGFTDQKKAEEVIGTSARIEFYYAKTVSTPQRRNLWQTVDADDSKTGSPQVNFQRDGGLGDIIKPGTPEYADIIKGWELIVSGTEVEGAAGSPSGNGGYRPELFFSPQGAEKMGNWSRQHQTDGAPLAIVLDGKVLSIAPLKQGAVITSEAVIDGSFSTEYVNQLTTLVKSGALPVDLKLLGSEKVDPTIGSQAFDKIVVAGIASFAVIALFLIVYYAFPGFVALIALLLYVLFTIVTLGAVGATFSLAAIAGFILSVGMAVDANILVFERFKEEMKAGRSLNAAIELGFRRAFSAIIDSNACTILTSFVLLQLGTGPVKGFATTLIIGVLISLFTAVFVTRSLLMFLVNSGIGTNPKLYALDRNWFGKNLEDKADTHPLPIVEKSKKWFLISLASIVVGLPFVFIGGLKGNVEFRGGFSAQYKLAGANTSTAEITKKLEEKGIKGANVKLGGEGSSRFAEVTVAPDGALAGLDSIAAIAKIDEAVGLGKSVGSASVGPAIQQETITNAILAVVLSSLFITIYLAFRFGLGVGGFVAGLRFGFSAIGALLHDVFVVLGVTAMVGFAFGWEISALFITSMLTVIGFSVHDTIVIFDRIRENLHKPLAGEDFKNLVNRSITQSFARSINTSMTVIVTLIILLIFGTSTPELKLFCATMLAGIISGTYSSIYNASPILYLWDKAIVKSKGEEFGLMGLARADAAKIAVISTAASPTAPAVTGADGRSYGQVRRRANKPTQDNDLDL
jgi:SecD/SecF fusion protein